MGEGGDDRSVLLGPTGNPTQYEVIADGQIVGRIALFSVWETIASLGYGRSILPSVTAAIRRTASSPRARPLCRRSQPAGTANELQRSRGTSGNVSLIAKRRPMN
jgi:hypothetical protein